MPMQSTLQEFAGFFDDHNVAFQTAELGKVDFGGGGTIAYIAALYGMEVIDSGVAVLSMHAPWELPARRMYMRHTRHIRHFYFVCINRCINVRQFCKTFR